MIRFQQRGKRDQSGHWDLSEKSSLNNNPRRGGGIVFGGTHLGKKKRKDPLVGGVGRKAPLPSETKHAASFTGIKQKRGKITGRCSQSWEKEVHLTKIWLVHGGRGGIISLVFIEGVGGQWEKKKGRGGFCFVKGGRY